MKRDWEQEIDDLRGEVKSLTRQLKKAGGQTGEKVEETASHYIDEARDYYDELSQKAKEEWSRVQEGAKAKGKELDQYAREKPWQTAGMAAAAGFLLAMMIGRRERR